MEFFLAWLFLTTVSAAAIISPGPAFIMMIRTALTHGRKSGMFLTIGYTIAIAVHVTAVLAGIAIILTQSVILFNIMKYAGAAYLLYLGFKAIRAKKDNNIAQKAQEGANKEKKMAPINAVIAGFLTEMLNPKAVIFFGAVFAQFIQPDTTSTKLVIYASTPILIELIWYAFFCFALTHEKIKTRFMALSHWVERVCGGLLMALGVRLALSKL